MFHTVCDVENESLKAGENYADISFFTNRITILQRERHYGGVQMDLFIYFDLCE